MLDYKRIAWITAFFAVNNIVSFSLNFGGPYYVIMGAVLFVALYKGGIDRMFGYPMLLLYIAIALSIVGNDIPSFFHPWARFATFILMTLLLTPFIRSDYLVELRRLIFEDVQILLEVVVVLSTIALFIGFGHGRGGFVGVTNQAMLMSPIAALVMIRTIHRLRDYKHINTKLRVYYIALLIMSLVCWLLPASRTSVIAGTISLIVYFMAVNDFRLGRAFKTILVVVAILGISYTYWSPLLNNLTEKNEGSIRAGGFFVSREQYWEQRVEEFKSSPLIGIGFASLSISEFSTIDVNTGGVESGSSWLSILSMTGIFGFLAFLSILYFSFYKLFQIRKYSVPLFSYLLFILIFFCIHMNAEGYIFGAGGFLFFVFWNLIGAIDSYYINTPDDLKSTDI